MTGSLTTSSLWQVPAPTTVPDAFRAIVERHGGRCAIEAEGETLTYEELDRRSNRVSHALLAQGGEEPVVMVCPIVPESLVAMLGALKAGRMFVPLDSRDPADRVTRIRERIGALTLSADTLEEFSSDRDDDPCLAIDVHAPSLVYFTSGSTGEPKGTIKGHNELALAVVHGIEPGDRFALMLPLAFAASITPVFATLLAGGTCCLFDPTTRPLPELAAWLDREKMTVFQTAPAVMRALAGAIEEQGLELASVREVIVGGDVSRWEDLQRARSVLPRATLKNLWGSTEAGYIAMTVIEPGEPLGQTGPVPFRRVMPWHALDIVDESGRPLPSGEAGEVRLRGRELSLGYWGDPQVDRPFVEEQDGERSIRVGDRGRLLADGSVEHLGRADLKVKVNGQMVDPQAVERELISLPEIGEAVVSPAADAEGDARLVAYVVAANGAIPTTRNLRLELARRLPPFMVPSGFHLVERIPRNPRGKVDRRLLRDVSPGAAPREAGYVEPRNEREQVLAAIVEEVLGLDRVGAHDDVFELGADSLSTVELALAVQEELGVALTPGDLLEAPTVEALALLAADEAADAKRVVCPLYLGGSGTPFFCVSGGGSGLVHLRGLARRLDRPTYSFIPRGFHKRALPDRSIELVAVRYAEALRTVQTNGPYLIGGYSYGGLVAREVAGLLEADGESVALLALIDPTLIDRAHRPLATRISTARPDGFAPVAKRVSRRYATRARDAAVAASAGIVRRRGRAQTEAFFTLSARMAKRYKLAPYEGSAFVVRSADWGVIKEYDFDRVLKGPWQVADAPGDHESMFHEPNVATTAAALRQALAAADPAQHP